MRMRNGRNGRSRTKALISRGGTMTSLHFRSHENESVLGNHSAAHALKQLSGGGNTLPGNEETSSDCKPNIVFIPVRQIPRQGRSLPHARLIVSSYHAGAD